ncbi:MAG: RpiB/LacA/LacB family sugar-phosphate isomerase [Deltaproteobacteria bacterium]|nr:RpiB/LacA/LacB family sugar-phosphate isomerase [Deltaproteobacteria bacterium]
MIRRLGAHTGKRIYFGYDRYIAPILATYRDALSAYGTVIEAVDEQLHYLSSAELVCTAVRADPESFGVLCCGTGMGMSIAANKFRDIYAARCMTVEDAEMARTINNSNVLCIAAKTELAINRTIISTFATTAYTGRKLEELERITQFETAETPPLRAVPAASRYVVLDVVRRTA